MKINIAAILLLSVLSCLTGDLLAGSLNDTVMLLKASRDGNVSQVEKALKGGEDPNVRLRGYRSLPDDFTPLMLAAKNGHLRVVKLLLRRGAFVGLRHSGSGKTALDYARLNGHNTVVKLLGNSNTLRSHRRHSSYEVKPVSGLIEVASTTPSSGGSLVPGTWLRMVIAYDLSRERTEHPGILEVRLPDKTSEMLIDKKLLTGKQGKINLSYCISDYDLAHLNYGDTFTVKLRLNVKGLDGMVEEKKNFKLLFKNGQRAKTAIQKKYMKSYYSYGLRREVLYQDRIVTAPNDDRFKLLRGSTVSFAKNSYILIRGELKTDTPADINGKKVLIKGGNSIFFSEKGFPLGGTLAREAKIKSGERELILQKGSFFMFHESGFLKQGILARSEKISLEGKEYLLAPGSKLGFFPDGRFYQFVTAGPLSFTIAERDYLLPSRTFVHYKEPDALWQVYNPVHSLTLFTGKMEVAFDRGQGITFFKNGSIEAGLLQKARTFYLDKVPVPIRRSTVTFHRDGSFESGDLARSAQLPLGKKTIRLSSGARVTIYKTGSLREVSRSAPLTVPVAEQKLNLQGNGITQFYDSGILSYGHLSRNQYVKVGNNKYLFRAGELIMFHPNGVLKQGVAARQMHIQHRGVQLPVSPGKTLYFDIAGKLRNIR